MMGEALAGLGAIKTAFDLAKGLQNIHDTVARDRAVIDLQKEILAAQQAQFALVERVSELEKEVAGFKAWDAEKQRYELKNIGFGTFAYMLKPDTRGTEPPHWLCPNCYAKGQKVLFQNSGTRIMRDTVYRCPNCQGVIAIGGQPEWIDDNVR